MAVTSPKGAEGVFEHTQDGINADVSATKKWQSVARECRAALLENDVGLKRLPRVLKESPGLFKRGLMRTFRRRKSGEVLPEGAVLFCWGTFLACNVAQGCRAALLGNTLGL